LTPDWNGRPRLGRVKVLQETTETQRDEAATKDKNLCTTEATESRRKTKNKWVLSELPIPGCAQNQGLDVSAFSLQQKNEDTEVLNLPLPQASGQ
jgi:hypothetical protein